MKSRNNEVLTTIPWFYPRKVKRWRIRRMIVRGKEIRSVTRCTRCVAQQHLHSPLSSLWCTKQGFLHSEKSACWIYLCICYKKCRDEGMHMQIWQSDSPSASLNWRLNPPLHFCKMSFGRTRLRSLFLLSVKCNTLILEPCNNKDGSEKSLKGSNVGLLPCVRPGFRAPLGKQSVWTSSEE